MLSAALAVLAMLSMTLSMGLAALSAMLLVGLAMALAMALAMTHAVLLTMGLAATTFHFYSFNSQNYFTCRAFYGCIIC